MIRVLVVDDSMFMRGAIAKTLTATGAFEVVGQARDGQEALQRVLELKPDVVSMDFNMPGWTGIDAVHAIMQQRPTPIVMFSAHTQKGAKETLDALAAGAVDFVTKPAGEVSADLSKVQDELTRKLTAAAASRPRAPLKASARSGSYPATATPVPGSSPRAAPASEARGVAPSADPRAPLKTPLPGMASGMVPPATATPLPGSLRPPLSTRAPVPAPRPSSPGGALPKLCIIAVSTGGPVALTQLVPALPADTRFAIIIVQHMPAHFTAALAERLDALSPLSVREAQSGDRPRPGLVLIAPGDQHLELDDRGAVVLGGGAFVNGCRPAADVTMLSAARVYGRRTIGVVLTGMGRDGTAGALAIRRAEGRTLAQDEESSVIFGMPRAAIEAGAIEEVAPLGEIAARLRYL
jgi:two-component system chemotaxis response regulator CheB